MMVLILKVFVLNCVIPSDSSILWRRIMVQLLVHEILSTPELEQLWRQELDEIRLHIIEMRRLLRLAIEKANPDFDAEFIEHQHGMFSCLPITAEEQELMEQKHHIYMLPNARMNVAAMNSKQSAILAEVFAEVRAAR